ncbi:TlpA family protein disulfide reductase [Polaribacter porphyrae]|uniref:Thioredoxin domain-containing protein n=1 Tax=Polaribacter porphyrae TaxID=1137780 RepID=A0A2S7WNC1_9FLAO|nr:TlpA disulfide reductase family protein [Polaribacter porphyrae]PQJ79099.1 hypothetical protein BTO18_07920 [Polaribacter porphyrae]
MKIKILSILILSFLLSCKPTKEIKQEKLIIEGNIKNLPDGVQIMLMSDGKTIGKDTINNGQFRFSDSLIITPSKLTLMSVNSKTREYSAREFWANNSLTKINGNGKYLSGWNITNNTKNQKKLNKFINSTKLILVAIDSIEHLRVKSLQKNNRSQIDFYTNKKDSLNNIKNLKEFEIIKSDFNNEIAVDKLYKIVKFNNVLNKDEVKIIYNKLDDKFKNSLKGEGILIRTKNIIIPEKGDKMVDLNLFNIAGKMHKLSEYSGKYLLINFWGDGCYPTIKAIPHLNKLQTQNSEILTVIGISLDENVERWKNSVKSRKLKYTNLTDGKGSYSGSSVKYGADKGTPYYYLIDKNGIILENWFGYTDGVFKEKLGKHISTLKL